MTFRRFLRALALALAFCAAGGAHADQITDQARALLDKGDARAAYALLEPLESERAGDPDYDFLLGLAALDIGRNTNAVFALERVLAVNPNHARARAEIARAYYALGETKTAREQFETVRQQGVPPEVVSTIDRYLSAIERLQETDRTAVHGYLEATLGLDSNINSGPDSNNIAVPVFGGAVFTLQPGGARVSDNFAALGGGLTLRHPLSREWALTGGLSGNWRANGSHNEFDTASADGNLGLVRTQGKNIYTVALQANTFQVGNQRYRDAVGVTGQWQHNYDARNQASAYIQYADLRYPSQSIRNVARTVAGGNYAHAFPGQQTVLYGGAYLGTEDERAGNAANIGDTLWGARFGGQHNLKQDLALFANLAFEHRKYGGDDPFFLVRRQDDQWNLGAGVVWMPAKEWRVTPQYQYTRNRSNVALDDYRREIISVTVRREF